MADNFFDDDYVFVPFEAVAGDPQKFKALDEAQQVRYLTNSIYDTTFFNAYLQDNPDILRAVSNKVLKECFTFKDLDPELQTIVSLANLDYFKNMSEADKKLFVLAIKDASTQTYMFKYLNLAEVLELESSRSIGAAFASIRDFELFKELFHNPNIFEKFMSKTKIQGDVYSYWYHDLAKADIQIQKYILQFLNDKPEYSDQFRDMYIDMQEEAKKGLFTSPPSDLNCLLDYYVETKDMDAIEKMKNLMESARVKDKTFTKMLSLYPEYLDKELMLLAISKTVVHSLFPNEEQTARLAEDVDLAQAVKEKLLQTPEANTYLYKYTLRFFNEKNIAQFLEKAGVVDLVANSSFPEVKTYLRNILQLNPEYLRQCELVFPVHLGMSKADARFVEELYPYFKPEDGVRLLSFSNEEFLVNLLKEQPELLPHVDDALYGMLIEKLGEHIIDEISFEASIKTVQSMSARNHKTQILDRILKDIKTEGKIIPLANFGAVYKAFSDEQRKSFLETVNPINALSAFCFDSNPEAKEKYFAVVLKGEKEAFSHSTSVYHNFLGQKEDVLAKYAAQLSPRSLAILYLYQPTRVIENCLFEKYLENPFVFNEFISADSIVGNLAKGHQIAINSDINLALLEIEEKDPELAAFASKHVNIYTYRFIEVYQNGLFEDKRMREVFIHLISKNPFLINTLEFGLLTPEFTSLNTYFLEKVTKYPETQKRILSIKENNPESFKIFLDLLALISNDESKIFDKKVLILLAKFENEKYVFDHELSEEELNNLLRYILLSSKIFKFSNDSLDVEGIDPLRYSEEIVSHTDKDLQNANSNFDIKNAIFKKYFDISLEDAKEFLRMYDFSLASLDLEPEVVTFIDNIKMIMDLDDAEKLIEVYKTYSPRYSIHDILIIENEINKAYGRAFQNSMFRETIPNKTLKVGNNEIAVIEPDGHFAMLIHSTNAYMSMPMIDGDYYKSWNMSSNVNNHGICTALVSEMCLGFPPLKDDKYGAIFGFTKFAEGQIGNMGPYDLFSVNSNYTLDTQRASMYMSAEDAQRYTRHSHNEIVIERKNLLDDSTQSIQPTYVIITSTMSENQINNALKAAQDMGDLPIVYIDFVKILAQNKARITELLENFMTTKDISHFKEALNLYESNRSTLFGIIKYDFYTPDQMNEVIDNYLAYCALLAPEEKMAALLEMEKALNEEKAKFDLVVDSGNRHKAFDLDYSRFIEQIYMQISGLNMEIDEQKYAEYEVAMSSHMTSLQKHDTTHMLRVTMLADKIAELKGLSDEDKQIVITAALHHDRGRNEDGPNKGHGLKGAEKFMQEYTQASEEHKKIISALIEYHELVDNAVDFENIMDKYDIPMGYRPHFETLSNILKDADALDRVRFRNPRATLDPKKLRTTEAKILIEYAKKLLERSLEVKESRGLEDEPGVKRQNQ